MQNSDIRLGQRVGKQPWLNMLRPKAHASAHQLVHALYDWGKCSACMLLAAHFGATKAVIQLL